ncbi:hypothetical protein [Pseudonocardia adelaidensis]|uniref:Uncharacterized protein n=1 Tax=Pseudonocardia adelaidensis TaxID=648754 RepID=A0ABP9NU35_9PSEU
MAAPAGCREAGTFGRPARSPVRNVVSVLGFRAGAADATPDGAFAGRTRRFPFVRAGIARIAIVLLASRGPRRLLPANLAMIGVLCPDR